jgi:disulfide oxidoreductase YuzD
MEPITLLLGALAFGATEIVKAGVHETVKDAYASLKDLLQRKFGGDPAKQVALDEFEKDQTTWSGPLAKALKETGAIADPEILAKAKALEARAKSAGGDTYNLVFRDWGMAAVGPGAKQEIHYHGIAPTPPKT